MKRLLLLLCATPLLFTSCTQDDNVDSPFAFMAVGNYWKMAVSTFGSTDTLTLTMTSESDNIFEVEMVTSTSTVIEHWFVQDGFLKAYEDGGSISTAKTLYKAGGAVGDTWSNASSSTQGGTVNYEIVDISESATVPAGTFNSLQKLEVTFSYAPNTQFNYWSPSIGQVYQTGFVTMSLVETNVN